MRIEMTEAGVVVLLFVGLLAASAFLTSSSEKIGDILETAAAKMKADFRAQA